MLEVSTLQAGTKAVQEDLSTQTQQLQQIEKSIQDLVYLGDSFTGEGASTIKNFYETYHLPFLKQLFFFYEEYQQTLSQIQFDLQAFESNHDGYIEERFLQQEVTDGLTTIKEKTSSLTEEANDIISSVSDIVSLPKLDEGYAIQGIEAANWKKDEVIGQLYHFDVKQAIDLQTLEHTAQAMIEYIQYISVIFQSQTGTLRPLMPILYHQHGYQPRLPMYTYSSTTLQQLSAWDNFYLNYVKSNPLPTDESVIHKEDAEAIKHIAIATTKVVDEYSTMGEVSEIGGNYYTLADGRILREYYDKTNVYRYQFVNRIPEEKISDAITFEDRFPNYAKVEKEVVNFLIEDYVAVVEDTSVETIVMAGVSTFGKPVKAVDKSLNLITDSDKKKDKEEKEVEGKGTDKETYQHLKDYKNNKYFTRSVEYNAGKDGTGFTYKVYQRGDINWDMVRTKGAKKGRGLTNTEASAKYGLAPILDDAGSVATLHHSQQKGVGPLYEASTRYHNISNARRAPLHPYKGKLNPFYPMDETTRGAFQKVDSINYWKIRGEEALGGK